MANDLVLITGASGYIAGHCIIQLLDRGYRVRGTLRSLRRADEVAAWIARARGRSAGSSLEFVQAELTDATGWAPAMKDVRYVLHVASPLPTTIPKNPEELIAPAREGALNVIRAAAAAKVERVVQTSSTAAVAYGRDDPNSHVFSEDDWSNPDHPDNSPYTRSKTIAERAAWDALPTLSHPLEWVAINPTMVQGPVLARDASASVELIAKMLRGDLPGLPRLVGAIVDVRDIADLHLRAMVVPKAAGQRYIGAGEVLSMRQMAEILKSHVPELSAKVPKRELPDWLVRLVGLFDKEVGGLTFELGKARRLTCRDGDRDSPKPRGCGRSLEGLTPRTARSIIWWKSSLRSGRGDDLQKRFDGEVEMGGLGFLGRGVDGAHEQQVVMMSDYHLEEHLRRRLRVAHRDPARLVLHPQIVGDLRLANRGPRFVEELSKLGLHPALGHYDPEEGHCPRPRNFIEQMLGDFAQGLFDRLHRAEGAVHAGADHVALAMHHRPQQAGLAFEQLVERGERSARAADDVAERRRLIALLEEEIVGGVQNRLAARLSLRFPRSTNGNHFIMS